MGSVIVRFRENKRIDSDAAVIGKVMEGPEEGKIAFLEKKIPDQASYADQEVSCDIIKVNPKSVIVVPVGNSESSSMKEFNSLFGN